MSKTGFALILQYFRRMILIFIQLYLFTTQEIYTY